MKKLDILLGLAVAGVGVYCLVTDTPLGPTSAFLFLASSGFESIALAVGMRDDRGRRQPDA